MTPSGHASGAHLEHIKGGDHDRPWIRGLERASQGRQAQAGRSVVQNIVPRLPAGRPFCPPPPSAELRRGVRSPVPAREASITMKQLILGGVRSGKSRLAEARAHASAYPVVYVATAINGGDAEMEARILRHRAHRPSEWRTIEEPYALGSVLLANDSCDRCLLVECLTLWLTNLLCMRPDRFDEERRSLCDAVTRFNGTLILVSNETGLGVVPLGELSRRFLDASGELHQTLATLCDRVTLTVAGLPFELKGQPS